MSAGRILTVEHEPAVARGLQYGLQQEGFAVTWAATGKEALDLAHKANPDLIILDLRLPDMSGFDVCRELRKDLCVNLVLRTANLMRVSNEFFPGELSELIQYSQGPDQFRGHLP